MSVYEFEDLLIKNLLNMSNMDSELMIENNNLINVDDLNKESKETRDKESKDELDENLEQNKDQNDESTSKQTDELIQNKNSNTLNQRETAKIGFFKTSRSSGSIRHPLNSSLSNNEISSILTPKGDLQNNIKHHLNEPIFNEHNQNASPNSTTNRQSILNNFNDWLNSISTGSLFQNILFANPFRRRGSRTPNSPIISRSNSKITIEKQIIKEDSVESNSSSSSDNFDSSILINTLKPTLKGNELIELSNFGLVEIDPPQENGLGHRFEFYPLTSHTFCDNCSEFIWTPVIHHSDTLKNQFISPLSQTVRCINCKYLCHFKCSRFIRINCQKQIDQNSIEFKDALSDQTDENQDKDLTPLFDSDILEQKILKYNERISCKGSGLGIYLLEDKKTFRGFLKVHLNLTRPINVVAGVRPPSIYDIINDEEATQSRRTLTTFYMPRDTIKNIHINSKNTSIDVIKAMLKKFKMVDNHQKFALYRRYADKNKKLMLSRLPDLEYPLKVALEWLDTDDKQFVLQENDTADVNWDNFLLPELQNFLKILDREEREHMQQVKNKYKALSSEIEKLINYKSIFSDAVYV